MKSTGKHGLHQEPDISTCSTLPNCKWTFLDSQVNGIAFIMQRSTGGIPVSKERATDPEVASACESLHLTGLPPAWMEKLDATLASSDPADVVASHGQVEITREDITKILPTNTLQRATVSPHVWGLLGRRDRLRKD